MPLNAHDIKVSHKKSVVISEMLEYQDLKIQVLYVRVLDSKGICISSFNVQHNLTCKLQVNSAKMVIRQAELDPKLASLCE